MPNSNFNEILDYGIFDENDNSEIKSFPEDVDWSKYRYFTKVKTEDGNVIIFRSIYSSIRPNKNDIGFLKGERVKEGKYRLEGGEWIIEIEKGFLKQWLRMESFTDKRKNVDLEVETIFPYGVQQGNRVFINKKLALDGRYFIGKVRSIDVNDSRIVNEVYSETLVFRPSLTYKLGWTIFGVILSSFCALTLVKILPEVWHNTSGSHQEGLFLVFFIAVFFIVGIVTIFNVLFFRLILDENSLIYGSFLNSKTVLDKDAKGIFFGRMTHGKGKHKKSYNVPIIVKKDGGQLRIDPNRVPVHIDKVNQELMKKYPLLSPEYEIIAIAEREKLDKEEANSCLLIMLLFLLLGGFAYFILYVKMISN